MERDVAGVLVSVAQSDVRSGMSLGKAIRRLRRKQQATGRVRPRGQAKADVPEIATALSEAEQLVDQGDTELAVDLLVDVWRAQPDPEVEIVLRDLRHEAALDSAGVDARSPWPPHYVDPFPGLSGKIPEVTTSELTTPVMGGAVMHHGALCIRGMFGGEQVDHTLAALREAQAMQALGREDTRWYRPLRRGKKQLRDHVRRQGGTWLADSPAATAIVLEELTASGVVDAMTGHFGERPQFSLEKSTLRRTPPEDRLTGWHQDGSFLGEGVRTMNVWIALTPCGGSLPASGLEVIPHRLPELLPKDPALGNAGVSFDLMEEVLEQTPSVRPEFMPGDALVFDERFMHRTSLGPELTEDRYALECWFFAPSHSSSAYTPLLV